jgi:hypothetical protein
MRCLFVLLLAASAAACAPKLHPGPGNTLSVEHTGPQFGRAVQDAERYCAEKGLKAKHVATDTARLSRFECVAP